MEMMRGRRPLAQLYKGGAPPACASHSRAMRLYAPLLFALFVLRARAATIPLGSAPELEKKIPIDDATKPQENNSSEQELIDQTNAVKDVENNLRNKPAEGIPVTVIIDEDDVKLKADSVANEVVEEDIVRPQADLRNPGPPQRQEHETQNPEYYDDSRRIVANLKKSIQDSQIILKQGFQGVTNDIQHWFENNEQISGIQNSIKNLQSSFTGELKKLNETVTTILGKQTKVAGDNPISEDQANNLRSINSQLNYLEENFNTGLKTLVEGVKVVATLRADPEGAASSESGSASVNPAPTNPAPANPGPAQPANPSPAPPAEPANNNPIAQYLSSFQSFIVNGFNNISQTLSGALNQNQPGANQIPNSTTQGSVPAASAVQADEQTSTQRPTIWQGVQQSFNNVISSFPGFPAQGAQNQAQPTSPQASQPVRPIVQITEAIQNIPFVQGMTNFFQGNRPQSTQAPAQAPVVTTSQPAAQPAQPVQPEKAPEPQPTPGPIRQIIQNNPIVQGLTSTVQRIQGSLTNPETPRDTVKEETVEKGYGYGNRPGDNNNGNVNSETDSKEELINKKKIEEALPEDPKDNVTEPEKVADKTE